MPKVSTSITEDSIDHIKFIAMKQSASFSSTLKDIIELGLKYHTNNRDYLSPIKEEEYLAQIMRITHEIFKLLYDKEKFSTNNASADAALLTIKQSIESAIGKKYDAKIVR